MLKKFEGTTLPQESREIIPDSKVGLSLSFCVGDILRGNVKEEEVKEIIAGTNASPEKLEELLKDYKKIYWRKNPDEGEAIARRLYEAGKIRQPRQEGKVAHNIAKGHWLKEDEVKNWEKKQEDE
ncbi:hypothetical protein KAU09_05420 [Candidatus Parcubacteria bacterium]|nr:hypothetical protein [Candidatus Parcubacteria bacterium]